MTSRTQQQRAEASNTPPAANSLLPGQLYVELADPMKLWAGTPTSLSASQAKVLFDSTAYLKLTGGVMTGNLTLSNNPPAPADAVPRSYVDSATGAAVPLTGGTMTGPLILSGPPIQPLQAAPKNYVDTMVPLAGGTMTGLLTLSGPPTAPLGAVTKAYSDLKLPLAGGTMTGSLILNADPTVPLQAVTKQYIDNHPAVTVGDAPPASPNPGALWWDSVGGQLYIRYQDPNSTAWIIANQSGLSDAPNDSNTYGRHANTWTAVATSASLAAVQAEANANVGRNLIHNATFTVAQRGAGPWTTYQYMADRWAAGPNLDTASYSIVALTDANRAQIGDENAQFAFQNVFAGNAGAAAYSIAQQMIENVRRLAGKTITVSFYAAAAAGSPRIGVSIDQNFGTGGSPSATVNNTGQSVAISATWARYSLTFAMPSVAGKTLGTNDDHNSPLLFWYSSGATNNARAGSIGVQSGTISLWGVQLEIGTQATPLDAGGTPQQILAQCQRFYQVGNFAHLQTGSGTDGVGQTQPFVVQMRATPTVTPTTTTNLNCAACTALSVIASSWLPYTTITATGAVNLQGTFTASADL